MASKFNMWASGFCACTALLHGLQGNTMTLCFFVGLSMLNMALSWAISNE